MLQRILQHQLGGREQHRQFGAAQPLAFGLAAQQRLVVGQALGGAIKVPAVLQRFDQPQLGAQRAAAARLRDRQRQRLQPVILQHQRRDVVGHRHQQLDPAVLVQPPGALGAGQRDLDVDLLVRAIDPGRIVDEVGVDPPARNAASVQCEFDPAGLRAAQIGPFAHHLDVKVAPVDPQRIVGRVANRGVVFGLALHIGADPAEPQKVGLGGQDRAHQRLGLDVFALQPQHRAHFGGERDLLQAARENAAALADQRLVVILPAGARQRKHPGALGPAFCGIRLGVEEDVAVIKGRDQPDRPRQQHAVAKHVARHIADADHPHRVGLHVDAHFQEVALHREPGPLGGDAHRLVVIALRAAAGEGIVQPEVAGFGQRIGRVGEGGGALVGGDHEVGVFAIADRHRGGVDHLALDDVVGDRQQGADEDLVGGAPFGGPAVAVLRRVGQLLGVEAALGPGRHDHRVLDPLRFHQPENLGAEVVAPVRPAQAAARHRPGAQVDALDPRRVNEDLAPRQRLVRSVALTTARKARSRRSSLIAATPATPSRITASAAASSAAAVLASAGSWRARNSATSPRATAGAWASASTAVWIE